MTDADNIIKALGGSGSMAPCPAHDDENPSLSVHMKSGRLLVNCQSGCTQAAVIAELKLRGLWPTKGRNRMRGVKTDRLAYEQAADDEKRIKEARGIYMKTKKAKPGGYVQKYLATRGLDVPENAREGKVHGVPCMIFAVVHPITNKFMGIHTTELPDDLEPDESPERKMFGPIKGGVVKFRGRNDVDN